MSKILVIIVLILSVSVSYGQRTQISARDVVQVGIFWPPVWEQTNLKQYRLIKKAHVDYVENVLGSLLDTEERNLKMLRLAEKTGLKMYVADPRVNGTENDVREMVALYQKYASTAGYYVVDEPGMNGLSEVGRKYKAILKFAPEAVPYVNLLPSWAVPEYPSYVDKWIESCGRENLKYLSFDCYPFMADGSFRNTYYENLNVIRKAGLKNGVKTSCYLQSVGIPNAYRRPSEAEMRLNVYSCLAYGIKNLVWFTYWTPTGRGEKFTNAIIDSCGNKTDLYDAFSRLNNRVSQLGKTLGKLDAMSVYHTGENLSGGAGSLPSSFALWPEDKEAELILTDFEERTTRVKYVMIVNKSTIKPEHILLKVQENIARIKEISRDPGGSQKSRFYPGRHEFRVDLQPGEGKLFRIE